MKIAEILYETRSITSLDHLIDDEILNLLKEECSEILKIYKESKAFLYRGEKKNYIFFKSTYPKQRLPKDSSIELHDLLNNSLKKGGFVAIRENSVFATPSNYMAEIHGYGGYPYVFFPKNGYQYTWSEKITDPFSDFDLFVKIINEKNIGIYFYNFNPNSEIKYYVLKQNKKEKEVLNQLNQIFHDEKFVDIGNFFNYFDSRYPFIKIEKKEKIFKILSENFDIVKNLPEKEMEKIYNIISQLYRKDNLQDAMKKRNEIMFTNSYYYMLSSKYKENILEKLIET